MFCSECGTKASGKFCHNCGTRLVAGQTGGQLSVVADSAMLDSSDDDSVPLAELVLIDWTLETNYRALLAHDEVRQRIATAGSRYRAQISGEEVLALFDSIAPSGVPLDKLCKLLVPLYDKMGIRTGKQARTAFMLPPGRVLSGVLCALASAGHTIKQVEQATDGCMLTATIPSNMWSFEGELVVSVHAAERQTIVEAATKIPGQLYDWGKSQKVLDELFQQSQAFAA